MYKISDDEIKIYDLLISIHYTNYLSNFLIIKAKKNGVKTLLVADGIMEWSNFFNNPKQLNKNLALYHPIIHDYFWTVGKEEMEYFMHRGQATNFYLPNRIINDFEVYGIPNKNKILITTANTAYFNESEKIDLINILRKVKEYIERKNIDVVYRIFDNDLSDALKIDPKNNNTTSSFDDILKYVSVVITTPSSISLNAMYHNRSVGQIIYRDSPLLVQSGWSILFGNSIENTLDSLLKRDEDRLEFQKHQISKYLPKKFNVENEIEDIISSDNKNETIKIEKYINQNLYGLINSRMNINFEFFLKKIYLKLKGRLKIKFLNR